MNSAVQRLKIAYEILEARRAGKAARDASNIPKAVINERKLPGLRAALMGRAVSDIGELDLFTPLQSVAAVRQYMTHLADAPPIEKAVAAMYLRPILSYLGTVYQSGGGFRNHSDFENADAELAELRRDGAEIGEARAALFGKYRSAGWDAANSAAEKSGKLAAEVQGLLFAEDEKLSLQMREIRASLEQFESRVHDATEKYNEALNKYGGDSPEFMAAHAERMIISKDYTREIGRTAVIASKFRDESRQRKDEINGALAEHGVAVISNLLNKSPIDQFTAESWANQQTITKTASVKLKKIGYPVEKVRADIAEFYRLTHGRLAGIIIDSKGDRRANAADIEGERTGIVYLGSAFDKRVLWHEMGHHIENDAAAIEAATGFVHARRTSTKAKSLASLTGNNRFNKDEVAYEDNWFSPYIGKVYPQGNTEVFSMGLESFSDGHMLTTRITQDPEMFALILGFVETPPHPLYKVIRRIFDQAHGANAEMAETAANELEAQIARLAATVQVVADGWEIPKNYYYRNSLAREFPKLKYAGSATLSSGAVFRVFSASVRDYFTKRKKQGYFVIPDENFAADKYPDVKIMPGTLEQTRAALAYYQTAGIWPHALDNLKSLKELADGLDSNA